MKKEKLTIKELFLQTNKFMMILAIIPLLFSSFLYMRQIFAYQHTIRNVQLANEISEEVDENTLEGFWNLVTGQETDEDIITVDLREKINKIKNNTTTNGEKGILNVALKNVATLESLQKEIIGNNTSDDAFDKNKTIMKQVDSTVSLLSDILQDFVRIEIELANQKNTDLTRSLIILSFFQVIVVFFIIFSTRRTQHLLTKKVQEPISELVTMAKALSKGNFNCRLTPPDTPELMALTTNMNKMAKDLEDLIEENTLKQHYLAQSEVRVLQAQITPHFIYNSLDAIISLIDQKNYAQAQEMTYALSDFFRISLSKGKDWISVETEIQHIKDYLTILQIRYGKTLTFSVNLPEELKAYPILKMILQPIVENAVYHGTKFIRRVGVIEVTATKDEKNLIFVVKDNGIGMKNDQLKEVKEQLKKGIHSQSHDGYGLYNVNKRLQLYYGKKASINIESQYRKGTVVTLTVPRQKEPDHYV
ncbi:MAG TPA: sensor histidine kinase [Tetragenococcus sp.]|nr:sensor histidine kinase [Tetragenococcus sp.]